MLHLQWRRFSVSRNIRPCFIFVRVFSLCWFHLSPFHYMSLLLFFSTRKLIKADRCNCRWWSGHRDPLRLKYCSQQKALWCSRCLSSALKRQQHARERHYRSICAPNLIANGFGEDFHNHRWCRPATFPGDAGRHYVNKGTKYAILVNSCSLSLLRSICQSQDDLYGGERCQSALIWGIGCDSQIFPVSWTAEQGSVKMSLISENVNLQTDSLIFIVQRLAVLLALC